MTSWLLVSMACTLFMTGLVWFVQLVHYPLMNRVPERSFPAFELAHQKRTLIVVTAPMILEGISGFALAWLSSGSAAGRLALLALLPLLVVWTSTFRYQAHEHFALVQSFDAAIHCQLVRHNWIRTIAWTVRSALLLWICALALR